MWLWSCKNEPWRRDTHLTTHNLLHMDPNDVIFVKDSFSNLTGAVFTYCQPKTSLDFMAWSHFWLKIQFLGWVPTWTSRPALNWVLILPGDQCHPKVQDGGLPRLCSTQLSPLPCGSLQEKGTPSLGLHSASGKAGCGRCHPVREVKLLAPLLELPAGSWVSWYPGLTLVSSLQDTF